MTGEKGWTESTFEGMAENFLNVVKDTNLEIQEAWYTLSKINTKETIPMHTLVNFLTSKDIEKILKAAEKSTYYK